jgi:phosphoglycerate dehydrogenase-like enzyme
MSEEERLRVLWRSRLGAESARRFAAESAGEPRSHGAARIEIRVGTSREQAERQRDWAEVLVDGDPDPAMLDGSALRHVLVPYAGVAAQLREAVLARPRLALWNSHFNAAFVAQHALALLLASANRIAEGDRAMRRGDWGPRYDDGFTSLQLDGKTALLLGYGAIGREIEKRVRGLGMDVAVYRRRPSPEESGVRQFGPDRLAEALSQADVVLVSLPATPETERLLDRDALCALRPGSILVNVGRGEVVDAQALYDALAEGRLRGAALDVWWRYPESDEARSSTFPADPPLHELANVVMSPHRANQVADWEESAFGDVLETLSVLAAGGERNRVDPERGY